MAFIFKATPKENAGNWKQYVNQLDPLGTVVLIPCLVSLLLALQWGGSTYSWSDGRIIALFVVFAFLAIVFIFIQIWREEYATVPPHIIRQRSIASAFSYIFLLSSAMTLMLYYLPIWFQAVKGVSAYHSGVDTLPLILALVVGAILVGAAVTALGYSAPFMITGAILTSIGIGLMTTFAPTTAHPTWIGYQVILGLGLGFGMQQPSIVAQTVLEPKDVSTGVALMFFAQSMGGAVFNSVGQSILSNQLVKYLAGKIADPASIVKIGATELSNIVKPNLIKTVLMNYNDALNASYYAALAAACLSVVGALAIEWRNIKSEGLQ